MLGVHEREMIFGPTDPRAGTWWGTAPEFGRIHPEDLQARHAQLFAPSESAIVVVGDANVDEVEGIVRGAFGDWDQPVAPMRHLGPAAFPIPAARLHAIPAGGDESELRLREHAPTRADPDRPAFDVVTALLGGMFSARINHVLREEQGHTYGIHAHVSDYRAYSALEIDLAVPGVHMRSAVLMLIDELRRVARAEDIDPQELETARASALAEYRNRFITIGTTASTLSGLFLREQTVEQLLARARAIQTVTAEDVAGAAQRWVRAESAPLLVIGPYRNLAGNLRDIPGGSELVVWRW
jgi:zinc protease